MIVDAKQQQTEPLAIVGFACRLPGQNDTPDKFWEFLKRGEIASRAVPKTRFNYAAHFDGSRKPKTMIQDGGMFLDYVDPADLDAGFFEIPASEASSMDPNQRQLLEVVFEALENAGLSLDDINNKPIGTFVASFCTDYLDMVFKDPEDKVPNVAIGNGRAIQANRLSYFLNTKGPSVTIDTACSGSMQALDMAVRYIQNGDIDGAIVAACNLYQNPDYVIDMGNMSSAYSADALCHTFDVAADGYVKAEAVNAVIIKRLSHAVRDRDPIRGLLMGTASTSNGRTAGIASPSSEAQAMAIRNAYANAGITDLRHTTYLECHGTGTQAGDPMEVNGVGSVFSATRSADNPLLIGSVKSNVGHSEPAAGSTALIKVVLALENGMIPGTPTFINPSPKIDFVGNKVKAFRTGIPWPAGAPKRASINSFGYGGSNAHAVVELPKPEHLENHVFSLSPDGYLAAVEEDAERPSVLVLSANDVTSLRGNIESLGRHLIDPRVQASLSDLAYTLSQRRTRHWHRAFLSTRNIEAATKPDVWVTGKNSSSQPTFGFVFTGQGAQWPSMGKDLVQYFPWTKSILKELDDVLQSLPQSPQWSLLKELTESRTPEHLRQPEFSQPLVTALQLCIISVLESWGIKPSSTVGHSSGEIAAAYAAGLLDRAGAITAAYYRGRAAVNRKADDPEPNLGMLAVGLGASDASKYLTKYAGEAWIACFNSPSSVTVSGKVTALEALRGDIQASGSFARLLQVDLAYHSELMSGIADEYESLLGSTDMFRPLERASGDGATVTMVSSVTGSQGPQCVDAAYWKANMVSPVRFDEAVRAMLEADGAPSHLIEIGPSGALAGPVSQILKSIPSNTTGGGEVSYVSAWARGGEAGKKLFDVAGHLWVAGASIDMARVNGYAGTERTIVDLPNYQWNHSTKYWHENPSSKDWRFRKYPVHDLIGSKVLGTPWNAPVWRHRLNVANLPYIQDHRIGGSVIMPGAGYVTMAVEGMYQKHCALLPDEDQSAAIAKNDLCYRFRDVRFRKALVLEEGKDTMLSLALTPVAGNPDWHGFRVWTTDGEQIFEHAFGLVRVQDPVDEKVPHEVSKPLKAPQPAKLWYDCHRDAGVDFGPHFQRILEIEAVPGERHCRTVLSLEPPPAKHSPQSYYPVHPAALDGCFQAALPSNVACDRPNKEEIFIPCLVDELVINRASPASTKAVAKATTAYSGRGRPDTEASWLASSDVYDAETGQLLVKFSNMQYVRLDAPPPADPHTFHWNVWKPDVELLEQHQVVNLVATPGQNSSSCSGLDTVINLTAHKKPTLNVLEMHIDDDNNVEDVSSIWFKVDGGEERSARAAYGRFDFCSTNPQAVVKLENQHGETVNTGFHTVNMERLAASLPEDTSYDLVIVKARSVPTAERALMSIKPQLAGGASAVILTVHKDEGAGGGSEAELAADDGSEGDAQTPVTAILDAETSSVSSAAWDSDAAEGAAKERAESALASAAATELMAIGGGEEDNENGIEQAFYLPKLSDGAGDNGRGSVSAQQYRKVTVVHLTPEATTPGAALVASLQDGLEAQGWSVAHQTCPLSEKPSDDTVMLVLDELSAPVMPQASAEQWEGIQALVASGRPLLWATQGAQQQDVSNPDGAMINGLFRVARMEDPSLRLATLDVDKSTDTAATIRAITKVLQCLGRDGSGEAEYRERGGVLEIPRVVPDTALNAYRSKEKAGLDPVVRGLHATDVQVSLWPDKLGTLHSLQWRETEAEPAEVAPGHVEVEVMAVGVNFKDVAITMGIVSDNERHIGFESAGIVRRLGPGVTAFKAGQRVFASMTGSYSNRVRVLAGRCGVMPDWMTFEQAATIPAAYGCALYAMCNLGNLREGQSVLIHSATGGVGIAAVELAKHKKAQIFATAGTEEKRAYLEKTYGIPKSHIFSSRNADFAKGIRELTEGRGVDLVLNSLIGELLDASWRLLAEGGTMVEIGKRDILDRNGLSMEPFDRNCSFRALDMSSTKIMTEQRVSDISNEILNLLKGGHIQPIRPMTTFTYDKIPDALALIQSGRHMGKIVISLAGQDDVELPIRPAVRAPPLRRDASYLIIGSLKGACGTLAIQMAKYGAGHIMVCSRSGIADEASQWVVEACASYGCQVHESRGDVGNYEFVRNMFQTAAPRIAGVIQGAMVLRDKPFETMTVDDYHTAIHPKVNGTWNLHQASQASSCPLDFFTMLSSTAGVIGNKGQANYAAANTFLDAFASYRQGLALPANTVDLGVISDVGYVAMDSQLGARLDKPEWTTINERTLRRILGYSILLQGASPIRAGSSAQMITGITYPLRAGGSSELAQDPRFGYLFNSRAGGAGGGGEAAGGAGGEDNDESAQAVGRFRQALRSGADAAALQRACAEAISAQVVKLMRLEEHPDPDRPLSSLGLDSLAAVELRNWIRWSFAAELTTLDITNARSLLALSEKTVSKLPDSGGAAVKAAV